MAENAEVKVEADVGEAVDAFRKLASELGSAQGKINAQFKSTESASDKSGKKVNQSFVGVAKAATDASKKTTKGLSDIDKQFKKTADSSQTSGSKMEGGIGSLVKRLGTLAIAYMSVNAAIQGFKSGVETIDQVDQLSQSFGVSMEKASAYRQAIKDLDVDQATFTGSTDKLRMALSKNEDRIVKMGVVTRDSSKALLSQEQIFQNAIKAVGQYKDGADRAAAGQAIFGTNLDDTNKLLGLNAENLAKSAANAEMFGLMFTGKSAAALNDFKGAMADMGSSAKGVIAVLVESLLPVITNLANFITNDLSASVGTFKVIGEVIGTVIQNIFDIGKFVFDSLKDILGEFFKDTGADSVEWGVMLQTAFDTVKVSIAVVIGVVKGMIEVFKAAGNIIMGFVNLTIENFKALGNIKLDLSSPQKLWESIGTSVANTSKAVVTNYKTAWNTVVSDTEKSAGKIVKIIGDTTKKVQSVVAGTGLTGMNIQTGAGMEDITSKVKGNRLSTTLPTGTKGFVSPSGGGGKSDQQDAEERKLLEEQFKYKKQLFENEATLRGLAYDKETAALEDMLKQGLVSYKDYYSRIGAISKARTDSEIQARKLELEEIDRMSALAKHESERVKLSTDRLVVEGQIAALKAQQVAADEALARKERDSLKLEREELDRLRFETANSNLSKQQKENGTTDFTAQKQRNALALEYNTLLLQQAEAELAAAQASGTASDLQIAQLTAKVAALRDASTEVNTFAKTLNESVANSLQTNLEAIMNGTKTISQGIKGFFKDLAGQITKFVAEQLAQKLMGSMGGGAGGGGGFLGMISSWFGGGSGGGGGGAASAIGGAAGGSAGGGFMGMLGGLFGGGFAKGGGVSPSMNYLVGEKGPEMFVPATNGTIMTADQTKALMKGGSNGRPSQAININVNTPDASSFRSSLGQIGAKTALEAARVNFRNN